MNQRRFLFIALLGVMCGATLYAGLLGFQRVQPALRPAAVHFAPPCPNADDLQVAVLNKMPRLLSGFSAQEAASANPASYQKRLDRARACLAHTEDWAKALPDTCVGDAYLGWVRYYRSQMDEAEGELQTHAYRDGHRSLDADARVNALMRTLPVPPACPR